MQPFIFMSAIPQGFGDDLVLTTTFPKRELAAADTGCHSNTLLALGLAPSARLVATDSATLAEEKVSTVRGLATVRSVVCRAGSRYSAAKVTLSLSPIGCTVVLEVGSYFTGASLSAQACTGGEMD